MPTKQEVLKTLEGVYDPDYRNKSIVEMELVSEDDIHIFGDHIEVQYGLTAPLCPFSAAIGLMIKYALEKKLALPVQVGLRPGHRQTEVVTRFLESPEQTKELMVLLESSGILQQCVRI